MQFRFVEPTRDFSNGLGVLQTYHGEFLVAGEELLRLVEEIHAQGINEARAYRCVHLHSYYTRAGPLHHQDEERALFPLIVNRSFLLDGMIERLTLDHEEIEQAWQALAPMLSRPEHITDTKRLTELAQAFERLQREHLTRENEDFFPQVAPLLSPGQLLEMGTTMARLRRMAPRTS